MTNKNLFVCGMFRSGTTLLGRVLNAHKGISIASDPYLPFFKFLRSDIASNLGIIVNHDDPLNDYFFDDDQIKIFKAIQSTDFSLNHNIDLNVLRNRIQSYGMPYSPKIMNDLDSIHGQTYKALFEKMLNLLDKHYSKPNTDYFGFKEVWADEFIPAIIRNNPNAKVIQIVRDPRAICASNNVTVGKYSWLFLAKQWRKLASLAWHYEQNYSKTENSNLMVIKYESLILDPELYCKKICEWLQIDFDPNMLNTSDFVDGSGASWKQNTSYSDSKDAFNTKSIDKWREILNEREVRLIEAICGYEMAMHGYKLDYGFGEFDLNLISNPPIIDIEDISLWARPYMKTKLNEVVCDMSKEFIRDSLIYSKTKSNSLVNKELVSSAFLLPEVFEKILHIHHSREIN